jgi:sugar/nucleoside kinase (ribokinase family)
VTGKILVVGDVMTDVIARPHGPIVRASDRAATIRPAPGGSGANQAAWLGHLGVPVAFAGRVGAVDAEAQAASLRAHGVAPHLAADPDLPTGILVTLLDADGERSFLSDRAANTRLCAADLPPSLLDGVRLLHVSGYSLFSAGPREAVLSLAAAAGQRGIPLTVDACSAGFLAEVGPAAFLDWTAGAAILFANEDEAAVLTGEHDPAHQLSALSARYHTVVLKRGAAGAMAVAKGGPVIGAAAPHIVAVDTTGAGDAFMAGFLDAYLRGLRLADGLAAGVALGARAASLLGGRPPTAGLRPATIGG